MLSYDSYVVRLLSTVQCRDYGDLSRSHKDLCRSHKDYVKVLKVRSLVAIHHKMSKCHEDKFTENWMDWTTATMLVNKGAEAKVLRYGFATYIVLVIGPSNQSGVVLVIQ